MENSELPPSLVSCWSVLEVAIVSLDTASFSSQASGFDVWRGFLPFEKLKYGYFFFIIAISIFMILTECTCFRFIFHIRRTDPYKYKIIYIYTMKRQRYLLIHVYCADLYEKKKGSRMKIWCSSIPKPNGRTTRASINNIVENTRLWM